MIHPKSAFPVYVVPAPVEAIAFYQSLGFAEVFNSGWYVHLATESGVQVGFLELKHPSQPEFLHLPTSGVGSLFSLEVDDAAKAYEEARKLGLKVVLDLKSEEWGQKHFMLQDPHGLVLDIVQSIEPSDEFAKDYKQT
jgi:catechol 2,3-dioxygenase-like lactoylglutathione lyase family enzyme